MLAPPRETESTRERHGFVSGLRTYSTRELDDMIASVDGDAFEWETGRIPIGRQPVPITYLIGWPKTSPGV